MVDLCWTGGLTEGRKIAALAETWHRPFAPHDCIGPVGFAAAIHASFSQPNTLIQESVRAFYTRLVQGTRHDVPTIKDGYVYPMEGPGLGIELLPAVFERSDLTVAPLGSLRHRHVHRSCFLLKGAPPSSPAPRAASGARWPRDWPPPAPQSS